MPKVSVIMPAYNAEKYIKEAVDSVFEQTFGDFEFIIINDCSKDTTEDIILSYSDARIVYVKNEENLRVARTLNKGLQIAKGDYIARMDADDVSLPERFQKQVAYLDAHPEISVLGTNVELFDENGPICTGWSATDPVQMKVDLLFSCGLAHPSVMMRRNVITELGGYDPAFEGLEDYELWCRVAEKSGVTTLPDLLLRYRSHGGQVTKNPSPEHMGRTYRLKERQLSQLGISPELAGADLFCKAKHPRTEAELLVAAEFFDGVLAANRVKGIYDPSILKNVLCGIFLSGASELDRAAGNRICSCTELVSRADLRKYRLKKKLRKLLGR